MIGLSIARALTDKGKDVLILEREKNFGMGISARNSEVIHAGIYNPPHMLKSSLCIIGKKALYDYAKMRNIPHNNCGKLIVATGDEELEALEKIKLNAVECGVNDLSLLTVDQCRALEPEINAVAGILCPSSGVIDSHSYMMALLADVENQGGGVVYNTEITAIEKKQNGFTITTNDHYSLDCDLIINAAGLGAINVARMIGELSDDHIPTLHMAKGTYFSYSGKTNFKQLIYPIPQKGGLGIHLTLNMAGGVKFGPDVEFIEREDYAVNASKKTKFIQSIKKYYPQIDEHKLHADYAGIRPKLTKEGSDFNIQFESDHAVEGLVNLFGIESPGLTASLAIADYVTAGHLKNT